MLLNLREKAKTKIFEPKVLTDKGEEGGEWGDGLPQAAHHARHAATVVPPGGGAERIEEEYRTGRLCSFHLKGLSNEIKNTNICSQLNYLGLD